MSSSRAAKGQTSFEAIIVLAMVFTFAFAMLLDASAESSLTLISSAVKNTAQAKAALLLASGCNESRLQWVRLSGTDVVLNFSGCVPQLSAIADAVEASICSSSPDSDAYVDCGADQYLISVGS